MQSNANPFGVQWTLILAVFEMKINKERDIVFQSDELELLLLLIDSVKNTFLLCKRSFYDLKHV